MQDLIDRLEVATSEQDVLYVLVVLHQMKESGSLKQAINSPHSWKRQTALESIDSLPSQLSTLHRLIAQILLLRGARYDVEKGRNEELKDLVTKWEQGECEKAVNAQHLLSLDLETAADWIDGNLPLPPNSESLTGEGPLPAPPSNRVAATETENSPPTSTLLQLSPTCLNLGPPPKSSSPEASRTSSVSIAQASSRGLTSNLTSIATSLSPRSSGRAEEAEKDEPPELSDEQPVTLYLSNLPRNVTLLELLQLFDDINVQVLDLRIRSKASTVFKNSRVFFAFVSVKGTDEQHSIKSLDERIVQGNRISCSGSMPKANQPRPASSHTSFPPPSARLSTQLRHSSERSRSSSPRRVKNEEEDVQHPSTVVRARRDSNFSRHLDRESTYSDQEPSLTRLHLGGLPETGDPMKSRAFVEQLFAEIGVEIFDISTGFKDFAFVGVRSERAEYCRKQLYQKRLAEGSSLRCEIRAFGPSYRSNRSLLLHETRPIVSRVPPLPIDALDILVAPLPLSIFLLAAATLFVVAIHRLLRRLTSLTSVLAIITNDTLATHTKWTISILSKLKTPRKFLEEERRKRKTSE
ncbi:uncharacterized protein JCM6883_005851 [Sporobolomyces salmoneus]|uniref:uncharacterized protein n=1 Tax=Sporobolomyces salmoneus TaxID=183962 RepID=UPI00317417AE